MKISRFLIAAALFGFVALLLTSCSQNADPGPLQEEQKDYTVLDFDHLEMTDALDVTVVQGSVYSITAKGDRRDVDDLEVKKIGSTLRMSFKTPGRGYNRQYTTYVTITMPSLNGVVFSGAVTSKISGFATDGIFDMTLSGASTSQMDINAGSIKVGLSGASELNISGITSDLQAVVSGASELHGFDLATSTVTVKASGASKVKVSATQKLNATATGASDIRYRGNPTLNTTSNGASTINAD